MVLIVLLSVIVLGLAGAVVYDRRHKSQRFGGGETGDRLSREAGHQISSGRTIQNYNGTFGG